MLDRAAVFVDRDGCLTEEVGYVNHVSRIRLLPRAADAIRRLNGAGVPAIMVTNQAGIARGYFTEALLHAAHAEMVRGGGPARRALRLSPSPGRGRAALSNEL